MKNWFCTQCKCCKYYEPTTEENKEWGYDGICHDGLYMNGRKIRPTAKVLEVWSCKHFVDKKTGLYRFECDTLTPEPKRTPLEIEDLRQYIEWLPEEDWHAWNFSNKGKT